MTREELYALVWKLPASEVARRCGVSNSRLRKICQEFDVPIPNAGYWTKVAYGKPAEKPPLPANEPRFMSRVNAVLRKLGEIPLRIADAQIQDYSPDFAPASGAPAIEESKAGLHPVATMLQTRLEAAATSPDGYISASSPDIPYVLAKSESLGRIVKLIDILFRAFVAHGIGTQQSEHGLLVSVEGEVFAVRVYSPRLRKQRAARRGTEQLVLEIYDPRDFRWSGRNLVGQWRDRTEMPIELALKDIVPKVFDAAKVVRQCRNAVEQHTSARQMQAQAKARRLEDSERSRRFLLELADDYSRLERLLALADYLRANKETGFQQDNLFDRALDSLIDELEQRLSRDHVEKLFIEKLRRDS